MKRKINLILSLISFTVTSMLLVMIMFAWYAVNKVASVTGGTGMTASDDYQLELQRGVYDSETSSITWTNTTNMAFSNISPGNVFYFRIKITGDDDGKYTVSFGNVSSSLVDGKLKVSGANVCLDDNFDTVLYAISNNKVTVNSQTLYSISGTTISLSYYLIHNVFYVYDYGTTEMAVTDSDRLPSVYTKSAVISSYTSNVFTMTESMNEGSENYYYFALEFNEAASIVSMPDGTSSSNCYLYQKLYIGNISVDQKKEG